MTWAWFMQFWHTEPGVYMLGRLPRYGFFILDTLRTGPKHGIGIVAYVEVTYGVQLIPGSLYTALGRLEERGWITALPAEDRRQPYQITAAGRDILRVFQARAQASRPA